MRLIPILLLALLPLSAQAVTGKDFLKQCDAAFAPPDKNEDAQHTASRLVEAGTCVGFIGGNVAGIGLMGGLMKQQNMLPKGLFCLPSTLTPHAMYSEVTKAIRADKDNDKKHVRVYVYEHFVKTYPCPDAPAAK